LRTLDELSGFGIQFLSQREAIDTEGPPGRAIIVIVSAMAELERLHHHRARPGGHAPSKAGGPADREVAA
jgi:DNA invertase Pin-like site-specific DNA recombinase